MNSNNKVTNTAQLKDEFDAVIANIKNLLSSLAELSKLGILRSNRPVIVDYSEWLVAKIYNLILSDSGVQKAYDATDNTGETYQNIVMKKYSILFTIITFGVFASLLVPQVHAGLDTNAPWPKYGGDQFNRSYSQNLIDPYFTVRWLYDYTGSNQPSPIVDENNVIYVSNLSSLIALNPDGSEKWTYNFGGTSSTSNYASPVLDDMGRLWVEGWDGTSARLFSVDSSDGSLLCSFNTGYTASSHIRARAVGVSDDSSTIYFPRVFNRKLYAINASDCTENWSTAFPAGGWWEDENMAPAIDSDGIIYLGYQGGITAFNPSGTVKWTYTDLTKPKAGPVLSHDEATLYFLSNSPDRNMVAIRTSDGSEIWHTLAAAGFNYSYVQPSLDLQGRLFMELGPTTGINSYRRYNPITGALVWDTVGSVWTRNGTMVGGEYFLGNRSTSGSSPGIFTFDKITGDLKETYFVPTTIGKVDNGNQSGIDTQGNIIMAGQSQVAKLAAWTLKGEAEQSVYHPGDTVSITVTTSMLQMDPTAAENNQVQILAPSGGKTLLDYLSDDGDMTTWTGDWIIPTNEADGTKTITIEATSYKNETDTSVNFETETTGTNNTGIVAGLSIVVDDSSPIGSIEINDGSDMTQTTDVTLTLSATDTTTSVSQMMISNSSDFNGASWETYATSNEWTLTSTEGEQVVYVKYKDEAGNVSEVYSVSIVLAYPTPTPTLSLNSSANLNSLSFSGSATDSIGLSQVQYQMEDNTITSSNWIDCTATDGAIDETEESFSCAFNQSLSEGKHTVYLRTIDTNDLYLPQAQYASYTFTYDATSPNIEFELTDPQTHQTKTSKFETLVNQDSVRLAGEPLCFTVTTDNVTAVDHYQVKLNQQNLVDGIPPLPEGDQYSWGDEEARAINQTGILYRSFNKPTIPSEICVEKSLDNGYHQVEVVAFDSAGNSQTTGTTSFLIGTHTASYSPSNDFFPLTLLSLGNQSTHLSTIEHQLTPPTITTYTPTPTFYGIAPVGAKVTLTIKPQGSDDATTHLETTANADSRFGLNLTDPLPKGTYTTTLKASRGDQRAILAKMPLEVR